MINAMRLSTILVPNLSVCWLCLLLSPMSADAQLIDRTRAPNLANEGINKSISQQVGTGRGNAMTPDSSCFIISRDPFRSIRRGRQLFQRKFTRAEGMGPNVQDGTGDVNTVLAIGAGLADSCAACHGRPRGSAGFGGDVVTRPDSRDAPHLFGLGLKEMLADEITADLRAIRDEALTDAKVQGKAVNAHLVSKGIDYGSIMAQPDGSVDTSKVHGINPDLRVRPFFAHGGKIAIREFIVGALNDEMGLQAPDHDLAIAAAGGKVTTLSGMVMDGSLDQFAAPTTNDPNVDPDGDHVDNEIDPCLVDHLEFYLLNYFKPGLYEQTERTKRGRKIFERIGCASCHVPDLRLKGDRRVADVETVFDPDKGIFNGLYATATLLHDAVDDGSGFPSLKPPGYKPYLVRNIFTDFKRHNLGPNFYERNYDGTIHTEFMTTPLWGVGSTPPYGHDGRSINLTEVILRHGGEAQKEATAFEMLSDQNRNALLEFLNSLVLFPPDDTASNLDPGNRQDPHFPQSGHGSIKLSVLFNDPQDKE